MAQKTKTVTQLKKALWEECRRITKERYGNTCYTCRRTPLEGSNWHVGHFLTSSVCSMPLRYDLANLRPQCFACNIHKSGNWLAFESRLVEDEGQSYVDELKQKNKDTLGGNYGRFWIEQKTEEYKSL